MGLYVVFARIWAAIQIIIYGIEALHNSTPTPTVPFCIPVLPLSPLTPLLSIKPTSPAVKYTYMNSISTVFSSLRSFASTSAHPNLVYGQGQQFSSFEKVFVDFGSGMISQAQRLGQEVSGLFANVSADLVMAYLIYLGILAILIVTFISHLRALFPVRYKYQKLIARYIDIASHIHPDALVHQADFQAAQQSLAEERAARERAQEQIVVLTHQSREHEQARHQAEIQLKMEQLEKTQALERASKAEAALSKSRHDFGTRNEAFENLEQKFADLGVYADDAEAARLSAANEVSRMQEDLKASQKSAAAALELLRMQDEEVLAKAASVTSPSPLPSLENPTNKPYEQEIERLKKALQDAVAASLKQTCNAAVIRNGLWKKIEELSSTVMAQNEEIGSLQEKLLVYEESSVYETFASVSEESWSIDHRGPVLPLDLQYIPDVGVSSPNGDDTSELPMSMTSRRIGLPMLSDAEEACISSLDAYDPLAPVTTPSETTTFHSPTASFDLHSNRPRGGSNQSELYPLSGAMTPTTSKAYGPELPSTPKFKPLSTSSPVASPTVVPAILMSPRLPLRELNCTIYPLSPTAILARSNTSIYLRADITGLDELLDQDTSEFNRTMD